METIEQYKKQQEIITSLLQKILAFLEQAESFGIPTDQALVNKISAGIKKNQENKLTVALVGGFSEGKTSIAAAWLEKYDKESMQISHMESTDHVKVYDLDDGIKLVDTPGLFGFKENADKVKYRNITKKYVSEADIIFYVMGPTNPIKESHKDDLVWLFNDLKLKERTVFVLSKFDEVADIEDAEDYSSIFEIKKQDVKNALVNFKVLEVNESFNIVAVSANPYDEGISYWLEHMQEYKCISHISDLQRITTKIITDQGIDKLMLDSQQSIVQDTIKRIIPEVENEMENVDHKINALKKVHDIVQQDLNNLRETISSTRSKLRGFIISYFKDLILQLMGTQMDNISFFFEENIGKDGIIIENTILERFEREIGTILNEISKSETNFNNAFTHYSSTSEGFAIKGLKTGGKFLKSGGVKLSSTNILKIRDVIFPNIKFKPWGAVNLAKNLSNAFAIIGGVIDIGFELWDSYDKQKKEEIFINAQAEMKTNFETQREEYLNLINNEQTYASLFNPGYENLVNQVNMITSEIAEMESYRESFKEWKSTGEYIENEFNSLK